MKPSAPPFPWPDYNQLSLLGVTHYHQQREIDPIPVTLPDYHERVELVTGGRGWIQEDERWREVTPGDLIWNKPQDDTIGRSDWKNPYRCLAVTLKTSKKKGLGIPRFSRCSEHEERNSFVAETVKCFFTPEFDRRVLLRYTVERLLFWVHCSRHFQEQQQLPEEIRTVLSWIDQHYSHSCPIESMAARVGWSASHLHRVFRIHLGKTPHKMLMSRRIRMAQEQLASTRYPIKRVAVECGFADASALIHAFRASQGITPTAYRKRHIGSLA